MADDLYTPLYREALDRAAKWHNGQIRKGSGVPYISHLLTVSALVWEDSGNETEAIAALLHDAVEDSRATISDVRDLFGNVVATIVLNCSDSTPTPGEVKAPWFERKVGHLAHLRTVASQRDAESTMRVVGADKLANVRSLLVAHRGDVSDLWGRFKGGLGGSVWYYSEMAELVGGALPGSMLARELRLAVDGLVAIMNEVKAENPEGSEATMGRVAADLGDAAISGDVDATEFLAFEIGRAVAARDDVSGSAAAMSVLGRWLDRPESLTSARTSQILARITLGITP